MPIEFRCRNCGKLSRAADEHAGKRAKCPHCGERVRVPAPDSDEPLNLAPLDSAEESEQKRLVKESRDLTRRMLTDQDTVPPESQSLPDDARRDVLTPKVDIETLVIEYAVLMGHGKLNEAQEIAVEIRGHMAEAGRVIERLTMEEVPHTRLANIPPPVLVGFLKQLRVAD